MNCIYNDKSNESYKVKRRGILEKLCFIFAKTLTNNYAVTITIIVNSYLRGMAVYAHDKIVPDEKSKVDKKSQVAEMFNSIAGNYDFLNRFLSAGIDKGW